LRSARRQLHVAQRHDYLHRTGQASAHGRPDDHDTSAGDERADLGIGAAGRWQAHAAAFLPAYFWFHRSRAGEAISGWLEQAAAAAEGSRGETGSIKVNLQG